MSILLRLLLVALFAFALSPSPASAHLRYKVKVSGTPVTTTSATAVNVTGLAMTTRANVDMWLRCKLAVKSQTSTSRVRIAITGPTGAVTFGVESYSAATTKQTDQLVALATLTPVGDTPTTDSILTIDGVMSPTAVGTYQVQFASETAGQTSTVELGSLCEYGYQDGD